MAEDHITRLDGSVHSMPGKFSTRLSKRTNWIETPAVAAGEPKNRRKLGHERSRDPLSRRAPAKCEVRARGEAASGATSRC
jgi:hypothetical protein